MKHKVYMRDWYFNAGIIGFLKIVCDGKPLDECTRNDIFIGENYIEFEDSVFEGFEKSFIKYAFLKYFNKTVYIARLNNEIADLEKKQKSKKAPDVKKLISKIEKSPYKDFLHHLNFPVHQKENLDDLTDLLNKATDDLASTPVIQIYEVLNAKEPAKADLLNFVSVRLKGISSYTNISKYIPAIEKIDDKKKLKDSAACLSCCSDHIKRNASIEFNNAVSNMIGFNKDNVNWAWGFQPSKTKLCPLCALIYNCAFFSFAFVLKKIEKNWLNYLYFVNHNTNLTNLYNSTLRFETDIAQTNEMPVFGMLKESIRIIQSAQSDNITKNINFIEIIDNPILAGQGTKGYNLYNYTIDKDIAAFLYPYISDDKKLPGYYTVNKTNIGVKEELIKLSIKRQVDYLVLNRFMFYYVSDSVKSFFPISSICAFIQQYILNQRRRKVETSERIIKKGFKNGIELRNILIQKDKKNQINGIVYRFLNDLKIADREKFLNKYIRIMMAHEMPVYFSDKEMLDKDMFLHFGYSFINGLLMQNKKDKSKNEDNQNK